MPRPVHRSRILPILSVLAVLVVAGTAGAARWAAAAGMAARGGKPLPAQGSTTQATQDAAALNAWFERNFVQAYRKVGRRDPTWDSAAEAFMRESAAAFLGLAPTSTPDLVARARTILDTGCDDPAVLFFAARGLTGKEHSREVSELLERAYAAMHETPYPRGAARFVASGLRRDYDQRQEGTGKRQALDPVELRWFEESLADGSYTPNEDVVFATHMVSGSGKYLFSRNLGAVGAAIQSARWIDPWVKLLLAGGRSVDEAWNSRGTAYASKVKPEEWKGMADSLAAARKALTQSWRLRPDRPEAATAMLGVVMAESSGNETPRFWFDRAVAARLDYMRAYDGLQNALRWRWSGDPEALMSLARECAATRRFDTQVPLQAFWAVEQIEWDAFDEARQGGRFDEPEQARQAAAAATLPPSPYKDDDVYELVSTVLMRYRRNPGIVRWQRYASFQAAVDYKAERYEAARKMLDELSGVLDSEARAKVGEPFPEARIYALASPLGSEVKRAAELYRSGKLDEALPLLKSARASALPPALPYLDHQIALAHIEGDLAAGREVRLFSTPTLAGWTPVHGAWKVEDGALVATSDARGHLIVGEARVGSDVEISADVEITSTSNGQFQAGILLGRDISIPSNDWLSFRVKKTAHEGEVAYFSQNFFRPPKSNSLPIGVKSHVVVQSWAGRLWAQVDGKPVVTDYVPEWHMPRSPETRLGFGGYLDDNTTVVRYRNVRLRRLTAAPGNAAPGDTATTPGERSPLRDEIDAAIDQVKRIVNQPVPSLPRPPGTPVEVFSPGWFHEGAPKPDFASVDVAATQQFPYDQFEYVTSDLNPGVMFRGRDLEFNAMTKYFYVDRSLPKKRLTATEMTEINRLYRIIAAREADLLQRPAAATRTHALLHALSVVPPTALYGVAGLLALVAGAAVYRRRHPGRSSRSGRA